MEASIILNWSEQKRLLVLNAVVAGQSTVAEAAASLVLSDRQVRRVLAAYRKEGAAALAHGNRGRQPAHATSQEIAQQVVALAQTTSAGCNQRNLRDLLAEREGIVLLRARVHRLLVAAGVVGRPAHRLNRACPRTRNSYMPCVQVGEYVETAIRRPALPPLPGVAC